MRFAAFPLTSAGSSTAIFGAPAGTRNPSERRHCLALWRYFARRGQPREVPVYRNNAGQPLLGTVYDFIYVTKYAAFRDCVIKSVDQ